MPCMHLAPGLRMHRTRGPQSTARASHAWRRCMALLGTERAERRPRCNGMGAHLPPAHTLTSMHTRVT